VLLADISRARAHLGFAPQFTDIDSIVTTAWQWHRNRIGAKDGRTIEQMKI
jgi:UDP-glucose 4-epimerase